MDAGKFLTKRIFLKNWEFHSINAIQQESIKENYSIKYKL